jgi:hypothetical protein
MQFPLELRFKILVIASQMEVRDAAGRLAYYVKQKAFKLKEDVTVFADAEQTTPLYRIAADRVIDFSAQYHIARADGLALGSIRRRGMRSLWRARYQIVRADGVEFALQEENPWVRVADGILGELPLVGILSGYFFHPAYVVVGAGNVPVARAVKRPAFLEGRYSIERLEQLDEDSEALVVMALFMMLLLERSRG